MKFCHQCGASLESGDRFCPQCGTGVRSPETSAPDQPSLGSKPLARPAGNEAYKGVGIRFAAHLIDLIIILVFYFIVGGLIAGLVGGKTDEGFALQGGPALLVMMLTSLFGLAYFTFLETRWNGQTLGKKLTGIRVTTEGGEPLPFSTALIRNILRVVDGLCFYLVGAILVWRSPRKQRLGDRIAHTVVIKAGPPAENAKAPGSQESRRSKIRFGSTSDIDYINMND
jgi:uncharacterized RDD family membrane protein YckC